MTLLQHLLLLCFLPVLVLAKFNCPEQDPLCLGSFFNLSSVQDAFLGDHGAVVFQNGLVRNESRTNCAAMSVIFARGTLEPGNVGILTGPPFFAELAKYLNGTSALAIQGVDYPASIGGFTAGGSASGALTMARLINTTFLRCPNTLLTLSGYSQGAQLVHLAAASLPLNTTSKISSVILFGDPKNGTEIKGVDSKRVLSICHASDDICKGGSEVDVSHLNYSRDVGTAAMFALGGVTRLGISSARRGKSGGGLGDV